MTAVISSISLQENNLQLVASLLVVGLSSAISNISFPRLLTTFRSSQPAYKNTSHEMGQYLISPPEDDTYTYSGKVSESEAVERAFYATAWPDMLNMGWSESAGGMLISPKAKKLNSITNTITYTQARYSDPRSLLDAGEMPLKCKDRFEYVKMIILEGVEVKNKKVGRRKKLVNPFLIAPASPAKKRDVGKEVRKG